MTWRTSFVSGNLPCFIPVLWLYSLLVSFHYPKNFIYLKQMLFCTFFFFFFAGGAKASSTQALNLSYLEFFLFLSFDPSVCGAGGGSRRVLMPSLHLSCIWPGRSFRSISRFFWRQNRCERETPTEASCWLIFNRMLRNTRSAAHQLSTVSQPYFNMSVQICCLFSLFVFFAVRLLLSGRMKFKHRVGEEILHCSAASVWLVKCSKGSKYLLFFFFWFFFLRLPFQMWFWMFFRDRMCDCGQISPSRSASLSLISFHFEVFQTCQIQTWSRFTARES